MDLVTVAKFDSVEEGYLAKNLLESEGSVCFIQDVATTGQLGHMSGCCSQTTGSQEHADRARHILREVERGRS
jgi:hypothetical protein